MRWNLFRSQRKSALRLAPRYTKPYRLALEELEDRRLLSTFTWVLNGNGDFNTAANWRDQNNSPGVPGANDDAVINVLGITITSATSNTVNSILCSATLTITNGTFTVADAGKNSFISMLNLNGGTTLQANSSNQANTGNLLVGGGSAAGTFLANAGAEITFTNNPHELDMNAGSSLTGPGTFLVAGGILTFNVNETAPANFEEDSGFINGPATFTISNTFTWKGGNLDGNGTTVVPAGTTLNLSGPDFKYVTNGHILNLAGTANWNGTGELDGSPGSTINNSGLFQVQNDAVSGSGGQGAGVIFNNSGVFTKSGTTGTTSFQGNLFNNTGTVNVLTGTLSFTNNYTQTAGTTVLAAGATLASTGNVNIQGGTLSGTGTVNANVTNSNGGTITTGASTGTLTITGNFTQSTTGVLNVKIGSATQFDTIAIGGAASLAGTLNVSEINSFVPSAGQAFKVLTFASSNGDFTTITGLSIPNNPNLSFNPVLNPSDFTLLASAPSAGVLQFSAPTYTANVTSGAATVTVVRNNGSQGSVTVNYATSDGTAMAGVSYTASSGTLTFAQGVTSQTITIPILSGAIGKGDQTVNLTLSTPTGGAMLGTQASAVLTLLDTTPNSQAGQLQFSTSAYTALVAGGIATITVSRATGSTGTVTVQYATSDGTAQAGVRYTATSGTLTFANGVTTQPFTIPLLNPRTVVGNQTVNLTLSNVTGGATLGSPVTAVLTIVDNNVSDDVSFISGVYHDALGRVSDAGGLASFQATVDAGRNQVLVQFATAYVISTENRSLFVTNTYMKYLGRTPSQSEVAGWVSLIQQGLNEEAVISAFVSSNEYFAKQGGTNSGWLNQVYQDLLGRARDPGSQPFLDQLNGGVPLGVVANALLGSTEYRTRVITQAYATYLQRQAGPGDVQAWISVVGNAAASPGGVSGDEQLLIGVLSSVEYFQTSGNTVSTWTSSLYTKLLGRNASQVELTNLLVAVLNGFMAPRQATAAAIATSAEAESNAVAGYYTQFLGRTASPSEISPWVNLILGGTSREQVIADIVSSNEYFQKQGGTNTQFVDQLYLDLLGRAADAGASGFINALNGGTATTLQVAAAILNSTEYAQRLVNQFYGTVLARQGSLAETNGWVQALTHGTRDEQVLTMLLASDEYFLRLHTYP